MNDDLISRERLKNTILLGNYDTQSKILSAIDNAPTVEERPQGEWKLLERDNQDIDVVCPFCNSIRFPAYSHGYTIEEVEEYLIRHHLPKFCEDCGADMRKGGAE